MILPPSLQDCHRPNPLCPPPGSKQIRITVYRVVIVDFGNLERSIAKDCGEDRGGEVGDDGQQDCNAGCDGKDHVTWL